jgi:YVTN family beta-propeller protein
MTKFYAFLLVLLSGSAAFAQNYTDGIFVLNEGGAGSGNASVSFIANNTVTNNIYAAANPNLTLGDTGQSIGFYGDNAYIVLNVSNKVEVVNKVTLQHVATITTGLVNPRYIAFSNGKAFITNWGSGLSATDDYIAVLDPVTNTIETTIAVTEGVERILEVNGKLYAAQQGGYGYGNSITVIDPVTLTVDETITVGDVPNSMVVKDGFLYVLCGGKPVWSGTETYGQLDKIDLSTNNVVATVPFAQQHPQHLKAGAGNDVYYAIDEAVFKADVTAASLPSEPILSLSAQGVYGIYGMDFIDNILYVADAGNYVSAGQVYIYDANGAALTNYTVGVVPNSFYKSGASTAGTANPVAALKITVSPNPATSVFYINSTDNATVKLYNIQGRLVKSEVYTTAGISVEGISAGLYIAEITTGQTTTTQRLIVQ